MKRDLRSVIFLTMALAVVSGSLQAQTSSSTTTNTGTSVTVSTKPTGARFVVDGAVYVGTQVFVWPTGSRHVLSLPLTIIPNGTTAGYQESLDGNSRYVLSGWVINNGSTPNSTPADASDLVVIADPSITSITAAGSISYKLQIFFSATPALQTGDCSTTDVSQYARPGLLLINGVCIASDATVFVPAGALTAVAFPFPGWAFNGWVTNGGPPVSYAGTLTINGPTVLQPQFVQAKRVNFTTNPMGFNLLIDHTPTPTLPAVNIGLSACTYDMQLTYSVNANVPTLCYGQFDFIPGSSHSLGAPSPQYDHSGNMWVIDSFSNGTPLNGFMVASTDLSKADNVVANFVPGMQAAFLTNPGGLKLTIDGRSNWITYNFAWGTGSSHTVAAADQVDSKGRQWSFQGWSNGGTASQTFTVGGPIRWTANFVAQPQTTIQSNPSGLTLQVDGSACTTPCVVNRPAGTVINVVAPNTLPISDTSRFLFSGWADGASSARTVTFNADQSLMVNYQTQFKLDTASTPPQGVSFKFNPASPDQFFAQNSGVTVTAVTAGGYKFLRWNGDLSGSYNQGSLMMGAPRSVVAVLQPVPYIGPAGIQNAAGVTPNTTVAPGSLASILGTNLATDTLAGRVFPLAQSIGNDTVTLNGGLLPLVFVSPTEIRALIPSNLTDGAYTLSVQSQGNPDVPGQFTVARNSPGLFAAKVQPDGLDVPLAWAEHADGTAITLDSPAVQGESVTLYGTGFGPVTGFQLDGFPNSGDLPLIDLLQVQAGASMPTPSWAGAVSGKVGIMSVKFPITPDMPAATTINVSVVINGVTSNQVALALQ